MRMKTKVISFLVLLTCFLLILGTGRINVRNFEKVQQSIETIYKDRLVVKGLIFELSSLLHQKEIAILTEDVSFYETKNQSVNEGIAEHMTAFRNTQLTADEAVALEKFSRGIERLQSQEKNFNFSNGMKLTRLEANLLSAQIQGLKDDLRTLSGIQLAEGERKVSFSDKAVQSMHEFANVENYALMGIGLLILLVFFFPRSRRSEKKDKRK